VRHDKIVAGHAAALDGVTSGATVGIGGFGRTGVPTALIAELCRRELTGLHVVANNVGLSDDPTVGAGRLLLEGRVRKFTCSFPSSPAFNEIFHRGGVELELVPQGTLAERLRAGGAGIGAFYTPTGAGTDLATGGFVAEYDADGVVTRFLEAREHRDIGGVAHVLEYPIRPDVALVKAAVGDPYGNLRFRLGSRNFNPLVGMAARLTIAEVGTFAGAALDPDDVHLPGIFVDRLTFSVPANEARPLPA
jgi:3-oxoacid CoA-transferase subunit A